MKKSNINYSQLTIIIVAFIAITFSIAMFTFTPSFAQKTKGDSSDTTAVKKKSVYKYKSVTIDKNGKRTETIKESSAPIKDKMKNEDEEDDNVTIVDNKNGKKTISKSYSYTYSDNDDDLGKAIKEITIAATKTAIDAIASIDFKEISKELEEAQNEINNVDWDKIKREMDKGIAEVNKQLKDPKLRKEVNEDVRKELEEAKKELEEAKRDIKRSQHEMTQARPVPPAPPMPSMSPTPQPPPEPVSDNNIESMLNRMEKDGLIDRSESYRVKTEDGALYINGEKQPNSIYLKYSDYIKDKSVNIKGHKGSLSITVND